MKRTVGLDELIKKEMWEEIITLDPVLIANSLSFENCLRLASDVYTGDGYTDDVTAGYAVRLLYQLKRQFPDRWKGRWQHETFLGDICSFAYRDHERYYACRRAARLVSPLPTGLALALADCLHMPMHLISTSEAISLYEYAIQEYPYLNALSSLKFLYQGIPGKEPEIERLSLLIGQMGNQALNEPVSENFGLEQPYDFKQAAKTKITFVCASSQQIKSSIKLSLWNELLELDPKLVIECVSFQDTLQLAYRFMRINQGFQEYAVRLLYALRTYRFGEWVDDWHNEGLLGYACDLTGRSDERFGAFDQACTNVPKVPVSIAVALVRSSLASDPHPLSFEEMLDLLQNALKENMYVDALQLLKQVYAHTGQQEKEVEVARSIASLKGQGAHSPSLLPACVTEPFESL